MSGAISDMARARSLLTGDVTCVLVHGERQWLSRQKGIAPMLGFLEAGEALAGAAAADRIVGKAAAMLFVKAGVTAVFAEVLSAAGLAFLQAHGVPVTWDTLTDHIENRAGTGICPMEETVAALDDPDCAYEALRRRAAELRQQGR